MVNRLFVNFDVRNYQSVSSLTGFALPNSVFTFIPEISNPAVVLSKTKVLWDFGDGTTSTNITATHAYTYPGVYAVSLYTYGIDNASYLNTLIPQISVYDFIDNTLVIDNLSAHTFNQPAGHYQPFSLTRRNSWQTYQSVSAVGYTVNLQVSGCKDPSLDIAEYYTNYWGHLAPYNKFLQQVDVGNTVEYVPVSSIPTSTVPIYVQLVGGEYTLCSSSATSAVFAGTSGTATVYFNSDTPKNYSSVEQPCVIFCTLDNTTFGDKTAIDARIYSSYQPTLGYLNFDSNVLPDVRVRYNPARALSFTTNGVDGEGDASLSTFAIPEVTWQNTVIPVVIKLEDGDGFTTKFYPRLSSTNINQACTTEYYHLTATLGVSGVNGFTTVPSVSYWSDLDPKFSNDAGGYFKGSFACPGSALSVKLTGGEIVTDPEFYTLDTLASFFCTATGASKIVYGGEFYRGKYTSKTTNSTLPISTYNSFSVAPSCNFSSQGFSVYGVRSGWLLNIDFAGNSNFSVPLSAMIYGSNTVNVSGAPTCIAVDSNSNAWVTLTTATSTIKVNSSGSIIAVANKTNLPTVTLTSWNARIAAASANNISVAPKYVDTDHSDNIWVSYGSPLYNYVIKYSSLGAYLTSYRLAYGIVPDRLQIDDNDNVYVVGLNYNISTYELSTFNDTLYCITSAGALNRVVTGLQRPTSITIDGDNLPWVTSGKNQIYRVNGYLSTPFVVGTATANSLSSRLYSLQYDTYDRLSVVNTYDNTLTFIPANTAFSYQLSSVVNLSAFPTEGDLNGHRWIRKYAYTSARTRTVTGESNIFNLYPDTGAVGVAKQHEDFNMQAYFNSLRASDSLTDTQVFFDQFLGTIVGGASAATDAIGVTVYEKIANFPSNIADVDTANIDALVALCEQYGYSIEQVNYALPPRLRRVADLLSIKYKKLVGERNQFQEDVHAPGITNAPNYEVNLGAEINCTTGTFPVSAYIIARDKFSDSFITVRAAKITGVGLSAIIPLSGYTADWGWGLAISDSISGTDIGNYYQFYSLLPTTKTDMVGSVIDWHNSNTTIRPNTSSYNAWVTDGGTMEKLISYEMTRGLQLFLSGS